MDQAMQILQLIFGGLLSGQQTEQLAEANRLNEANWQWGQDRLETAEQDWPAMLQQMETDALHRYEIDRRSAANRWEHMEQNLENRYGTYSEDILGQFGDVREGATGDWADLQEDVTGRYGGRLDTAMEAYGGLESGVVGGYGQRASDILGEYGGWEAGMGGEYAGRTGEARGVGADIVGRLGAGYGGLGAGYGDLTGAYGDRMSRNLANLEGLGAQEARDIREDYAARSGRIGQEMVSRGLAGTTIGANLQQGNLREQTDALARLNERLRREEIGLDVSLSGEQLGARERGLSAAERGIGALTAAQQQALAQTLGASGEQLGAMGGLGLQRFGMQQQLSADQLAAMERLGLGRIGMQNQLSADQLAAMERMGIGGIDRATQLGTEGVNLAGQIGADQLNLRGQLDMQNFSRLVAEAQNRSNIYGQFDQAQYGQEQGMLDRMLGWRSGIQHVPPDQGAYLNLMSGLGAGAAPAPSYPEPSMWDFALPGLISGGTAGATAGILGGLGGAGGWGAAPFLAFSDPAMKNDIERTYDAAILDGVKRLPIYSWRYKAGPDRTRHIGPMAPDFNGRFDVLDQSSKAISPIDTGGVALAAIKALSRLVDSQANRIEELEARLPEKG